MLAFRTYEHLCTVDASCRQKTMKVCVFVFVAHLQDPFTEQSAEIVRSLSPLAVDYVIVPFVVVNESYANLPRKSFRMLQVASSMQCTLTVKLDTDGMLCLNKVLHEIPRTLWSHLYVGKHSFSRLDPPPGQKSDRVKWHKTVNLHTYQRIRNHTVTLARYMLGGAYAVGGRVAESILQHTFEDYVDTGFEDANIGMYVNNLALVRKVTVTGSFGCQPLSKHAYFHRCKVFKGLCGIPNATKEQPLEPWPSSRNSTRHPYR